MSNFFETIWAIFKTFRINDAIDIIAITLILFYLFKLFRQTRAGQLINGVVVLLAAYGISAIFDLKMVNFILKALFEFAVIIIVVVFQPELRHALEKLGRSNLSKKTIKTFVSTNTPDSHSIDKKAISDVCDICTMFSRSKTGALIVFERESVLTELVQTGTILNSDTSVALLGNIFFNKAPLHDGACIIRDGKILAAGCILPLSSSLNISSDLGTRHRAAIGISEETDAIAVVVSEETGSISMAIRGNLKRNLDRKSLENALSSLILPETNEKSDLLSVLFKSRKEKKNEK